jgi:hypothetical protein
MPRNGHNKQKQQFVNASILKTTEAKHHSLTRLIGRYLQCIAKENELKTQPSNWDGGRLK